MMEFSLKSNAKCIKNGGLNIVVVAVVSVKSNSIFKKDIEVFNDENGSKHTFYI